MSVTGTGGAGGASWEPQVDEREAPAGGADAGGAAAGPVVDRRGGGGPALDPAAQALLGQLNEIADASRPVLPAWAKWLDGAGNVSRLVEHALRDGIVTGDEVLRLVTGAFDWGEMQPAERKVLERLLDEHAGRFEPPARQALAGFLGVADPLGPRRPAGPEVPIDLGLPALAGRTFAIHPDGYPIEQGLDQPPPAITGEGADRIYWAGKALAEAPQGVLQGVPAAVQERMLQSATAGYDEAVEVVRQSPVAPTDANKVRAGAAGTLLALYEGAATPALREAAAAAIIDRALAEPHEGLRASMYLNLEVHKDDLSAAQRARLDLLQEKVLPSQPPYDAWFKDGVETLEVVHYAHHECWEHATDPITRYQRMGLEVVEEGTAANGDKTWVLEGNVRGGDGSEQHTRIRVTQTHDEFVRDMDDPDTHVVLYTGHSNLGGNVSEALRRGPEENGEKMLFFGICRGQQNIFEVANKYPNAHLSTSREPSYFLNLMDFVEGKLTGIARRDTYAGMMEGTRLTGRFEGTEHYIEPDQLRRYEYIDLDGDGVPELGLDARDRFFDVMLRERSLDRTDLRPRDEERHASQIPAESIFSGVNFARTLITYHAEKSPGTSPLRGLEGDRFQSAGWFEGSDEAVRVTEVEGLDGKPVYNVSVNKAYANQSAYAIGALIQYEVTRHFAEQEGGFGAEEKARALLMTGTYLAYMYASAQESNAIMRSIGERAGVEDLGFHTVYGAIDAGGAYVDDRQVQELLRRVEID